MPRTDAASRVIAAPPDRVFAALVDPEALVAWLPPTGMTGRFEHFDARPGGSYRMVLTYGDGLGGQGKATPDADVVDARFVDIVPGSRVVQEVEFASDDPAYAGVMTMAWEVTAVAEGARVDIRAEGVPDGISAEDHATGLASSLANLAAFVERRHTGEQLASYTTDRPDVVRMVPPVTGPVLDVGCSTGRVGRAIREVYGVPVWGIEADEQFADRAERRLDRVLVGDAAELIRDPDVRALQPELVILADVLEHLADPQAVYADVVSILRPGGWVLVSVPNVAFWDTHVRLLQGRWPQRERGIHDRTHLRFFAVDNVRELVEAGPMRLVELRRVYRFVERPHRVNRAAQWLFGPWPSDLVDRHARWASNLWPGNLFTFQFLALARKDGPSE